MISFSQFLNEEAAAPEGKALKHLTHLEDLPIHEGHAGVKTAADFLDSVHNKLIGKKSTTHISTKYDGAPSIVFGKHPQTGKFFVASKSAFNKTPKINYTPEDIDANHGHAPGLAEKLKQALQHLPKVMPDHGGVYQGDLMFGQGDVQSAKGKHSFTPNTITYSVDKNGQHGRAISRSKLGVVVHTHYKGRGGLENLSAGPLSDEDRNRFKNHDDVYNVDPTIKPDSKHYTPTEQSEFQNHKEKARMIYSRMKPESLDALAGHGTMLEAHVNDMIRKGGEPSVDGYVQHLTNRAEKDVAGVKTPAAKDKKMRAHSANVEHILKNREHFEKALQLHGHLQAAKNVLTRVMAKANPFEHTIQGVPTAPEGAVAVNKKGDMTKFVDRQEFSRQNFLKGSFR